MQFQADILNTEIVRPQMVESTALGAVYLAGLAVGFYESKDDICRNAAVDKVFRPVMSEEKRQELFKSWKRAVESTFNWAKG